MPSVHEALHHSVWHKSNTSKEVMLRGTCVPQVPAESMCSRQCVGEVMNQKIQIIFLNAWEWLTKSRNYMWPTYIKRSQWPNMVNEACKKAVVSTHTHNLRREWVYLRKILNDRGHCKLLMRLKGQWVMQVCNAWAVESGIEKESGGQLRVQHEKDRSMELDLKSDLYRMSHQ